MKIINEVTVSDRTENTINIARRTLERLMSEVALPDAVEHAPGSIKSRIRVLSVRLVPPDRLLVALSMPGKYRPVEEGSGAFVGEPTFEIESEKWQALNTLLGHFKHVTFVGQPAQHFLRNALEKVVQQFPQEFERDLASSLSRSNR